MFWGSKTKKLEADKDKQVAALKSAFPSIRRPNNDDNLFEIKFVVDMQYSSLRVFIPVDFPATRPVLQAAGPVTHPWLDQFKQVNGSEKLLNWSKHSSLVEVVEESLAALLTGTNAVTSGGAASGSSSTTPPTSVARHNSLPPIPANAAAYGVPTAASSENYNYGRSQSISSNPPPASLSTRSFDSMMVSNGNQNGAAINGKESLSAKESSSTSTRQTSGDYSKNRISMPSLPSSFPELEELTVVQLQRLLNDEVALEAQVSNVEGVKQMQMLVDDMKKSNEDKARKTLQLEQDIREAKQSAEAQQAVLQQAAQQYNTHLEAVRSKSSITADQLKLDLKQEKKLLDKTSEDVGQKFVDGDLDLNSFVNEYLEKRTSYHELNAKMKVLQY